MKKKIFTLLCLCTLCIGSAWGATKTITIPIKGFKTGLSTTYQDLNVTQSHSNISFVAYAFNNSSGQIRGNKNSVHGSSDITNTTANFHLFNSTAIPGPITKIVFKVSNGTLQNKMYVAVGKDSQGSVTAVTNLTSASLDNSSFTFNFNSSDGYTFFKLCSNEKFTNGNVYAADNDAVTITYEDGATPTSAYTVTFDAGTNGSCSTTELTEASAGEGVTLPECTANTGYVFKGWSTTESGTTPDAGKAGESYKPSSDCTLYAVYNALYTITIEAPDNGVLVVKDGNKAIENGKKVEDGTELTVEATPNDGYKFRNWQAVDESTHTYTASNKGTYTINGHNVTFKANFDEISKYTINYMVNGVNTGAQENVYEGTALNFPTVEGVAGKVFCGWVKEAIDGTTNTKPTFVSTVNQTANEMVTYYAVFANKEGEGDDKYLKVTTAPTDWSGEYLLVYEYEDNSTLKAVAWTGVDATSCGKDVTFTNGEITTIPEGAVTLTIATMEGGYSIKVNGGENNGKYIDQTKYDNGLAFKDNPSANTLSYNENSPVITASVVGTGADEGKRVTMRYNTNADQKRFRYYKSGQQPIQLYLKHGATYSNYCTDISYTRTVNTANIGTLCVPYAFEKPDYMTLYNIVGKDESKIYFEENTATIEAGKPYLFRSTEGTITLTYTGEKATEAGTSNGLVGTFDGCAITPNADNYILSNNTLYYVDSEFNCGANRAYINIDDVSDYNPSAAKTFTLDFNDPTGITSYENDNDNENLKAMTVYNLNGMRVNGSYKGIVVVNGKKFINK